MSIARAALFAVLAAGGTPVVSNPQFKLTQRNRVIRKHYCRKSSGVPFYLEHVSKKLIDACDKNMLQLFESERFLLGQMRPSDREAL